MHDRHMIGSIGMYQNNLLLSVLRIYARMSRNRRKFLITKFRSMNLTRMTISTKESEDEENLALRES